MNHDNLFNNPDYRYYLEIGDGRVEAFVTDYRHEWELFTGFDCELLGLLDQFFSRPELSPQRDYFEVIQKLGAITHRQFRNGFFLMMRHQSYDGFYLVRRSAEASVNAFRIFKNHDLIAIYLAVGKEVGKLRKSKAWQDYNSAFITAPWPKDLPSSDSIQEFKDLINENFSHPSRMFIVYSIDDSEGRSDFLYFDKQDDRLLLNLYYFLALYHLAIQIWREILAHCLSIAMQAPNSQWEQLNRKYQDYRNSMQTLLVKYATTQP